MRLRTFPITVKWLLIAFVFDCNILFVVTCWAQRAPLPEIERPFTSSPTTLQQTNLPFEKIGPSDLLGIAVYDSPELSRPFRVDALGFLTLPMLAEPVKAAGLLPNELEFRIAEALRRAEIFTDPVVSVSVVEYRSRAVTVAGSVRNPITFQEFGNMTLLDAINDAGGLTEDSGPEIVVSRPASLANSQNSETINVRELLKGDHPQLNIKLAGGEEIRVPKAVNFFVVGNVKQPGSFPYQDTMDTTVLKALAVSGGLQPFTYKRAYIYRQEPGTSRKTEIEVPLRDILHRKSPDIKLRADDILYIPDAGGRRLATAVLERISGVGNAAVSTAIYVAH